MREVYWRIQFLLLTSMQRNIFCSGAPCSSGSSSGMEYLDTWHVKINFGFEDNGPEPSPSSARGSAAWSYTWWGRRGRRRAGRCLGRRSGPRGCWSEADCYLVFRQGACCPPAWTGTSRWTCICPRRWPCWWGRTCTPSHTGRSSQTWPGVN